MDNIKMTFPDEWEENNRESLYHLYDILINEIKINYPYHAFVEVIYNNQSKKVNKKRFKVPGPVLYF